MSPLRELAKAYAEKKLPREEYLLKRTELLNQIEVEDFTDYNGSETTKSDETEKSTQEDLTSNDYKDVYTSIDVFIYILGFIAAISLAYILYS